MHLIGCVRKGVPLPELPTRTTKKKLKKSKARPPSAAAAAKAKEIERIQGPIEAAKSPKRRSRLASLVGSPDGDGPRTAIPESNEPGVREVLHSLGYIYHTSVAESTSSLRCSLFLSRGKVTRPRVFHTLCPNKSQMSVIRRQNSSDSNQPTVPVSHQNGLVKEPVCHERSSTAGSNDTEPPRVSEVSLRE